MTEYSAGVIRLPPSDHSGDSSDKEKTDSLTTRHRYITASTTVSCDLRKKEEKLGDKETERGGVGTQRTFLSRQHAEEASFFFCVRIRYRSG